MTKWKPKKLPCCNYMKVLIDLDILEEPLPQLGLGGARLTFFSEHRGSRRRWHGTAISYCPFCGAKIEDYEKK